MGLVLLNGWGRRKGKGEKGKGIYLRFVLGFAQLTCGINLLINPFLPTTHGYKDEIDISLHHRKVP
jgi:hypothetical protein